MKVVRRGDKYLVRRWRFLIGYEYADKDRNYWWSNANYAAAFDTLIEAINHIFVIKAVVKQAKLDKKEAVVWP